MKPQLVFLLYNNRSGSTFLASQLARIGGIAVTVESSFLCNLLARKILQIQTEDQLQLALDAIYLDKGFENWRIPRDLLAADLTAHGFPISLHQLVLIILDRYHNKPTKVDTWILKIPALQHYVSAARSVIPNAKFLHIVRDPRAVINSQAKAKSTNTGMAMSINPVVSARKWQRVVQRLNSLSGPDLLEVKYEDLVADYDTTISSVCDFVCTGPRSNRTIGSGPAQQKPYYNDIPESQRHLHKNVVEGRPLVDRIDGWRAEMNETDIHLVQGILAKDMRRLGYEPLPIANSSQAWGRIIARVARHGLRSILLAPIRYARYAADLKTVRMRLATKISKLRQT